MAHTCDVCYVRAERRAVRDASAKHRTPVEEQCIPKWLAPLRLRHQDLPIYLLTPHAQRGSSS